MKRPLLYIGVLFVLGEVIGRTLSNDLYGILDEFFILFIAIVVVTIIVVTIVAIFRVIQTIYKIDLRLEKKWIGIGLILSVGGIISGTACNVRDDVIIAANEGIEAEYIGVVTSIEDSEYSTYVTLLTKDMIIAGKHVENRYKIRTKIDTGVKVYIGNALYIKGELLTFPKSRNYGEFNSRQYYAAKGIFLTCEADSLVIRDMKINVYKEKLRGINQNIQEVYNSILPQKEAGVIIAMTLGDKTGMDKEIKKLYQQVGISHLIAISGLHLAIIGMGLFKMLRRFGLSYAISGIVAIGFILSYGVLTGLNGACLRAIIMMIVSIVGSIIGRSYDMLTAMSLAGIIMIMFNGYKLTDPGFLLSFGAIAGISIVNPILSGDGTKKHIKRKKLKKKYEHTFKGFLIGKGLKLIDGLMVSVSVQLVTLPIILYFYYKTSVYGTFLNILVIPLMAVLMFFAIISGVVGLVNIYIAKVLIFPSYIILVVFEKLARLVSRIPANSLKSGHICVGWIVVYYIMLGVLLLFVYKKKNLRAIYPIGVVIGLSMIMTVLRPMRIVMMDAGQGDALYVRTKEGINLLIDGGSSSNASLGEYVMTPTLDYFGVNTIDYAFVSHGDEDHISGLMYLIENQAYTGIKIKNIVLPDIDGADGYSTVLTSDDNYQRLIKAANTYNTKVNYMGLGDRIEGDTCISCVHPSSTYKIDGRNGYSLSIHIAYREFSILFTGDLEYDGEEDIINNVRDCDVLKIPHHGSNTSTSKELLDSLEPEIALISCGINNSYGHPGRELIDRLKNNKIEYMVTKDVGAILIEVSKAGESYTIENVIDK